MQRVISWLLTFWSNRHRHLNLKKLLQCLQELRIYNHLYSIF
nr:MAG TPA: hypothetical protein [Bacteriophage sp.]